MYLLYDQLFNSRIGYLKEVEESKSVGESAERAGRLEKVGEMKVNNKIISNFKNATCHLSPPLCHVTPTCVEGRADWMMRFPPPPFLPLFQALAHQRGRQVGGGRDGLSAFLEDIALVAGPVTEEEVIGGGGGVGGESILECDDTETCMFFTLIMYEYYVIRIPIIGVIFIRTG